MPTATVTTVADFVELTLREDLGTLLGRWLRQVSTDEVRQGYEATLRVASSQRVRYWLLDLRRRGTIGEDSTQWVLTTFLPRLTPLLGGRVYLAFLMSPAHLSNVDQENGAPLVSNADCHVRLFSDEGLATDWLARRRAHENNA